MRASQIVKVLSFHYKTNNKCTILFEIYIFRLQTTLHSNIDTYANFVI